MATSVERDGMVAVSDPSLATEEAASEARAQDNRCQWLAVRTRSLASTVKDRAEAGNDLSWLSWMRENFDG